MAARGETTWVTVKVAARELGTTESRIRAAYRSGKLDVRDELVGGRTRKLVALEDTRVWAGAAPPAAPPTDVAAPEPVPLQLAPHPVPAETVEVVDPRVETVAELAEQALAKSERAEQQLAFLRNELAQLRASHLRIQEDYDRRTAEQFQAKAQLAFATATHRPARQAGFRRLLIWRPSA